MVEVGRVIDICRGQARVCIPRAGGGGACGRCGGSCHAKAGYELALPAAEGMAIGDRVEVEIELPNPAWSALVLFLIPLVLLMVGVGLWQWLAPQPSGEGYGLLIGLGLMAVWYGGVTAYDRVLRRNPRHQPKLLNWTPADREHADAE